MTIAVTGATGQLGSEIIKAAVALVGADGVVGVARTPSKAEGLGVQVRPGDYTDRASYDAALEGVDAVLLVSGMDAPDKRVGQHRNVIEAAKANGVRRFVYTSVQGPEGGASFSPIIQSNRQTEQDVRDSGMEWVVGRNGIYIEPDIDFIDSYKAAGEIANCAGEGRCGYTTRPELAYAYARMLTEPRHVGETYNLHGEAITQAQLTEHINRAFALTLTYRSMEVEDYRRQQVERLGEFMGNIITGIYHGIRNGDMDNESHFQAAAGRPHISWTDYFASLRG